MFIASNIAVPIGSTIVSILVLIIVSIVCCITVVALGKKRKRQNVINCNTQQFELQTIGSLETNETMTQTGSSRPLPKVPNTTLNIIPQRQNQNSVYITQHERYPVAKCRPLPPYNKNSNNIGPHEAQIPMTNPTLAPYQQQQPATYQHQAGHHPLQQPTTVNTQKPNRGRHPNTSAALASFETLPAHNPIVQDSKQQPSNVGNWQDLSDVQTTFKSPASEFLDDDHEEYVYYNMEAQYEEIKPLKTPPPPNYTDLFKN